MRKSLLIASLLGSAFAAQAQISTVVPDGFASTAGTTSFLGPFTTGPRRLMLLMSASELTAHLDRRITSIALRIPVSATTAWPAADVTINDFQISVGPGVSPANRSLTFASNFTSTPTVVRTGQLVIPTGSYTTGSSPNAFGPAIMFTTPYVYSGGNLTIDILQSGFTGSSRSAEATLATGGPSGLYGVRVSALWSATSGAATGSQANFVITQITSVSSAKISGTVTLLNSDGDASDETVQVQVVDSGNNLVASGPAPLNAAGEYSLPASLPSGTYSVYIKGDTFLKKAVTGVAFDTNTGGTANATLTNGDVNNDNEVGPADFSLMVTAFGSFLGDPNYSAAADLNDDEEVGPADFSILSGSFGEFGDDF